MLSVLVIAQLASLALHMHERGELLLQASGLRAAQRIADIVKLFETVGPQDRAHIAKVLSSPPTRVTVDQPPLAEARDSKEGPLIEIGGVTEKRCGRIRWATIAFSNRST